jgi:hypothetical protein
MSTPSKRIRPEVTGTNPDTTLATVDFPAPLTPTRARAEPAPTDSETSNRAR